VEKKMVVLYARPKQVAASASKVVWEVGEDGDPAESKLHRAHALIHTQVHIQGTSSEH
jgi:hypothetical protein